MVEKRLANKRESTFIICLTRLLLVVFFARMVPLQAVLEMHACSVSPLLLGINNSRLSDVEHAASIPRFLFWESLEETKLHLCHLWRFVCNVLQLKPRQDCTKNIAWNEHVRKCISFSVSPLSLSIGLLFTSGHLRKICNASKMPPRAYEAVVYQQVHVLTHASILFILNNLLIIKSMYYHTQQRTFWRSFN